MLFPKIRLSYSMRFSISLLSATQILYLNGAPVGVPDTYRDARYVIWIVTTFGSGRILTTRYEF